MYRLKVTSTEKQFIRKGVNFVRCAGLGRTLNSLLINPLPDELFFCGSHFSLYVHKLTISPVMLGFQPPNFTQVLLQPSSTRSWLKPHPPINKLAIVTASLPEWALCKARGCFLNPFVQRRTVVAHPEPTKMFLKLSPVMAMLSAPFWCTHPPPPVSKSVCAK